MSDINKLLEKYWNGETSIEEERFIKKHFQEKEKDVNSIEKNLKGLFSYFEQEKQIKHKTNIELSQETKASNKPNQSKTRFIKRIAVGLRGTGVIKGALALFVERKNRKE